MRKTKPGVEISAGVVLTWVEAFRFVRYIPHMILTKHGIGVINSAGEFVLDAQAFCPIERAIAAIDEFAQMLGPKKMFEVGTHVPERAILPPGASDIFTGMQVFDSGYLLNHRYNHRPMFDPVTKTMEEGIGHYRCITTEPKRVVMEVDAPYPCEFEQGIMVAWARRFEPSAQIAHLNPGVCRKTGADACQYEIAWR